MLDGRFNEQENLHMRFVLGSGKKNRSPQPPSGTWELYMEALAEFSHILSPDSLNTLYSLKAVSLKGLLVWE